MHPIEQLRYLARVNGADPALLALEAAEALEEVAREQPLGLVPSCRRLVARHLCCAPLWWLSARMLAAPEPVAAARAAAKELSSDATAAQLAELLPSDASVLVVGWPDVVTEALRHRGDLELLVASAGGEGDQLVRRLGQRGFDVAWVPDSGVGAAAAVADVVLVEALAAGPDAVLAAQGSHAAAAVAAARPAPVWFVCGVGRLLPSRLWETLLASLDASGDEPWERDAERVPAHLASLVVGPQGAVEVGPGLSAPTCPTSPELLRLAG